MILNISSSHRPATDLGYMLHKHPDKLQTFELSVGYAHVFYPLVSEEKTTASLLLDINPIDLVRGSREGQKSDFSLAQYVNDRPYVCSSFMSAAIAKVFASAMNGHCKDKPELVGVAMPFEVELAALPAPKGGEALIRKFFEPLGYQVFIEQISLDQQFQNWGKSRYFNLKLTHQISLQRLLSQLYILIPALDYDKHYFVSDMELQKLEQKGEGWLKEHPHKELIVSRYLLNFKNLTKQALRNLTDDEGEQPETVSNERIAAEKNNLHGLRLRTVADKLSELGAQTVLDLGCGEGKLMQLLSKNKQFTRIVGADVMYEELLKAKDRLYWDKLSEKQKERLGLFQSSAIYKDERFRGYDALVLVEVIEHLELNRLPHLEKVLFAYAQPKHLLLTTPNQEYNQLWERLQADAMRHNDHRFEWSRAEFRAWADKICQNYHYTVEILPVGEEHPEFGAASQMAVFTKI